MVASCGSVRPRLESSSTSDAGGAGLVIPVAVAKADGVGQGAIPEEQNRARLGEGPGSVEFLAGRIAVAKRDPEAFLEDALIGDQPFDAGVGVDGERLGGDRTLGRPASVNGKTGGAHQRQPLFELPDRVLGILERGDLRGRVGRPAVDDNLGVGKQRHDRVGVWAGGDLDAGEAGELPPEIDEFTRLRPKPGHHGGVVGRRKPAAPRHQPLEPFVPPRLLPRLGDHEEHLQVAQISRGRTPPRGGVCPRRPRGGGRVRPVADIASAAVA